MKTLEKAAEFLNSALDAAAMIACVFTMLLGIYCFADDARVYRSTQDKGLLQYKPQLKEAVSEEKRISSDQIGWICVPGTGIDFPVLQGRDNSEYLNRNPYGEFSYSGSVFLDYRSSPDLSDSYSVIYGHHMSGGRMFGCLDAFRDPGFSKEHSSGSFSTKEKSFDLEVFAVFECLATAPEIFRPGGCSIGEVRGFIAEKSGVLPDPLRPVLALTTCTPQGGDKRLVVAAYITATEVDY